MSNPSRRKFVSVKSGEWVQPIMKGYKMACCDCGLVHTLDFKIVWNGKKVRFRAFRDNRRTAALRRFRNYSHTKNKSL